VCSLQVNNHEKGGGNELPPRKKIPVLFKIETGDIDRGCSLSWVSQYQHEDEIFIPAMSYLKLKSLQNPQ
jgi:hypothetical protein